MLRVAARTAFGVAFALALATSALAITAWDQAKVTEIAGQLEAAVSGLQEAIRQSPTWSHPGQRTTLFQIQDNLRWIESEAGHLHAALAKGAGMEETLNSFRRIHSLRRETEVLARRTDVSAMTQPKLDKAKELLGQLDAYYPADASSP
jgi:hypothetical protein